MKCWVLFMMGLIILLLNGCAKKIEILTITLPCEVEKRTRPIPRKDALENLKDIFIYLEGLESDLKFCKGE